MTSLVLEANLVLEGLVIPAKVILEVSREQLLAHLQGLPISSSKEEAISSNKMLASPNSVEPADLDGEYSRFLSPHPGRSITLLDLRKAKSEAEIWVLIARRFPWMFEDGADVTKPPSTAKDIARLQAGQSMEEEEEVDQVALDLQALKPYLHELVDEKGDFLYGHQSKIAGILGGSNEGRFRKSRVLPAEAALKDMVEQGWLTLPLPESSRNWDSSTTSTPVEEVEPGAGDDVSTRVA